MLTFTRRLCQEAKIQTEVDIEKELFSIKRRMGGFHSKGNYKAVIDHKVIGSVVFDVSMCRHWNVLKN